MASVKWARRRFGLIAHVIIEGDTLTLCGESAEKSPVVISAAAVRGMACPDCREIITTAAASLEAPKPDATDMCTCGHLRGHHIYEEGACRPGFACPRGCDLFVLDEAEAVDHG